jgi:tRNA(Ile)-lysidine synthase
MQETRGAGLRSEVLAGGSLMVGFRQGGERFRPVGRRHSQELKKLLQEAGIPPWWRDRLPLLYVGDTLAAVATLGVAAAFAAPPDAPGWVMECVP